LGESASPAAVCAEFKRRHGGTLTLSTLTAFLTRLDTVGILAGARSHRLAPLEGGLGTRFYVRFKLFDPDRLFARMAGPLRWVWTPGFVVSTVALMLAALGLGLAHWAVLTDYALDAVREHYVAIVVWSELVVISHELAHGLTCKAFGGRVPEIG